MRRSVLVLSLLLAAPLPAFAQTPPPVVNPPPASDAPPPPAPPPAAVPAPPPPAAAPLREPIAGYANGSFFLKDPNDWFVLFPKGRLHVDSYLFPNRGQVPAGVVSNSGADPRPKNTIFIRRARLELQGTFARHFDFSIAGEFATVPAVGAYGAVTDAYVLVNYLSFLQVQAGQFDAPFTLENRTSDKTIDFMERSAVVRNIGVPQNKEAGLMLFGWLPKDLAYYSVGVFNGEGQNFRNQDNNPLVMGRAFVAPLATLAADRRWMKDIWVGGSFWYQKANNLGGPAAPNTGGSTLDDVSQMTTQGGFAFFNSNYNNKDASGATVRSHLAPFGDSVKWAVEANVPVKWIGARFELVHQSTDLAQYDDANTMNAALTRTLVGRNANLDALGYYVELYGWILGDVNYIETPGLETQPRIKKWSVAKEPRWGLQLLAKYEHIGMDVSKLPGGPPDMMGNATIDPAQGHYSLDVMEFGANAWLTKHVRLTCNYLVNWIDGTAPNVTKNFFFNRAEHELLFRIAIGL